MAKSVLTKKQEKTIEGLVQHFVKHKDMLDRFLSTLYDFLMHSRELMLLVHSVKARVKEPEHLQDKLRRKAVEAQLKGEEFEITPDNLFEKVNDLVGIRFLHLHTTQFPLIHKSLTEALQEGKYPLFEEPFARSWDNETRDLFRGWGISVEESPSLYTSVHYVVEANTKTRYTCEIQVRTLMEELWGEVDHTINYPHKTASIACSEQLKALARLTSGCSRLVDSIFRSHEEHIGQP